MLHKIAKYLNIFVVLLMTIDLVGAALTAVPFQSEGRTSYHIKRSHSSIISSILFEKAAEEESDKHEEDREKFIGAELADFSKIALLLSNIHTPGVQFTSYEQRFSVGPPLFAFYCVFLI